MTLQEAERAVFSYALRNKAIGVLSEDCFTNNEIRMYINDMKKNGAENIDEYIGKGSFSIAKLSEFEDDLSIISDEQFQNILLRLEIRHKKHEIMKVVKKGDFDKIEPVLNKTTFIPKGDFFEEVFKDWLNSKDKKGVTTSIEKFDSLNGGLYEPELLVIGARPGRGKTAMAVHMINHFLLQGLPIYFASLEMSKMQIFIRLASNFTKIANFKIKKKFLSPEEYNMISEYFEMVKNKNMVVNEEVDLTIEKLKYQSRKYKIVIIDYIQLLNSEKIFKSEYEKLEYISKEIKKMAKKNSQIVIALAQLNRDFEKAGRSELGHIKGAGGIEQNADIIVFLEKKNEESFKAEEIIKFNIMKYREGQTGIINLNFKKPYSFFENIEEGVILEKMAEVKRH